MSNTPKTPATPARLTALEARQADLEKRIAELERAATRQLPEPWTPTGPFPPTPPIWPTPQDIDDARCHVCNNRYKDMTHYVCNNDRCPNRVWYGDAPISPPYRITCEAGVGPYGAPGTTFGGPSMATEQLPHFAGSTTQAVGQTPTHLPQ